jgi:hypothetical protein
LVGKASVRTGALVMGVVSKVTVLAFFAVEGVLGTASRKACS